MGQNYFNSLPTWLKLQELGTCRFMDASEFATGCEYARGRKIVIVGCGAQGLNQGLNMRDSGLDVSYTLREISARARSSAIWSASASPALASAAWQPVRNFARG